MKFISNEELAELIKKGEKQYIEELWQQTDKFFNYYSDKIYSRFERSFQKHGVTLEDLKQEAFFIMLEMVDAYDSSLGFKFTTYAKFQYQMHIRKMLRIKGTPDALDNCAYLSDVIGTDAEGEELTLEDITEDKRAEQELSDVEELIYQNQLRIVVKNILNKRLTDLEGAIIFERYYNSKTFKQIASELGVSLSYVAERHKQALRKLKRHSKDYESFADYFIRSKAYNFTGYQSFLQNGGSSEELIVERIDREYLKHKTNS